MPPSNPWSDLPVARSTTIALLAGAAVVGFGSGALLGDGSGSESAATPNPTETAVALTPASVEASCQSPNSNEADGSVVTYEPSLVLDDDPSTAWRCPGNGEGERLTLTLAAPSTVSKVALVPGYAKTDPSDETDRYAQNRRLTKVRWVFDDGVSIEQELDPSTRIRDLQAMPGLRSDDIREIRISISTERRPGDHQGGTGEGGDPTKIVIEIMSSSDAPRNSVAIGSVVLSGSPTG